MTVHHLIRCIIEPTDATIIRCIFVELNQINLNMFRASLCPSSGEKEQNWLKLHVKVAVDILPTPRLHTTTASTTMHIHMKF
jgi:hypothetical protein